MRQDEPRVMRLARDKTVPLYGIDWKDNPGDGARWLGARQRNLRLGNDGSGRVGIELGVAGIPEAIVIDRTGRIRYRHAGPSPRTSGTMSSHPIWPS